MIAESKSENCVQEFWSLQSPCHSIFTDQGCVAAIYGHFTQDPLASLGTSHGSEWLGLIET